MWDVLFPWIGHIHPSVLLHLSSYYLFVVVGEKILAIFEGGDLRGFIIFIIW